MINENYLKLSNYIAGEYSSSIETRILRDFNEQDYAVIYHASAADIRKAKRAAVNLFTAIREVSLESIISVIELLPDYYFTTEEEIRHLVNLTGSPISFIRDSLNSRREWCRNIRSFMKLSIGHAGEEFISIKDNETTIGYKYFVPISPVVAFLPKNSDEESLYLMAQILLSRSTGIIKAASSACSSYSALKFIEALNKVIDVLDKPELAILKQAFSVLNLFSQKNRNEIVEAVALHKAIYVIFGSNETIKDIQGVLAKFEPQKILGLGTGFSASIVLADCDISSAAQNICSSVIVNNGNECIATNVVYVEKPIFHEFMEKFSILKNNYKFQDPFVEAKEALGILRKQNQEQIVSLIREYYSNLSSFELDGMAIIQSEINDYCDELPGPVVFVKQVEDKDEAILALQRDMEKKAISKNLCVAVFTKDKSVFFAIAKMIPTYNCKLNKPTHEMNMFFEHQGFYIVKELLTSTLIEA